MWRSYQLKKELDEAREVNTAPETGTHYAMSRNGVSSLAIWKRTSATEQPGLGFSAPLW
jgi:hypothetical protein